MKTNTEEWLTQYFEVCKNRVISDLYLYSWGKRGIDIVYEIIMIFSLRNSPHYQAWRSLPVPLGQLLTSLPLFEAVYIRSSCLHWCSPERWITGLAVSSHKLQEYIFPPNYQTVGFLMLSFDKTVLRLQKGKFLLEAPCSLCRDYKWLSLVKYSLFYESIARY